MIKQTSTKTPWSKADRRPVGRGTTLPNAMLQGPERLRQRLQRLDELDRAALLMTARPSELAAQAGILGATRWHGLLDAEAMRSALIDLHLLLRGQRPPQGAVSGGGERQERTRPIVEVLHAIDEMAPNVAKICKEAGLQTPEAVLASQRWVRRAAQLMSGFAGHIVGKERQRLLTTILGDAERLLAALPRFGKWAQARAQERRDRAFLARAQAITATLATLLPRLLSNAPRLLSEMNLVLSEGAEVPNPVPHVAEGALAIWIRHHPKAPNLSLKREGFLAFGHDLLALPVKALGDCKRKWVRDSTLWTALRDQVKKSKLTVLS